MCFRTKKICRENIVKVHKLDIDSFICMRCLNVKKKNLKLYKISKPKEIIIVIFRERINQISYLISFHSLE